MTRQCTGVIDPKWSETSHCVIIYVTKTTNDMFPLIQNGDRKTACYANCESFFPIDAICSQVDEANVAVVLRLFTSNTIVIVMWHIVAIVTRRSRYNSDVTITMAHYPLQPRY